MKTRYAIAGSGIRALAFARSLIDNYSDVAELVALYDNNETRMNKFNDLLGTRIATFTSFGTMATEADPKRLIICTPDAFHHELIELGFGHGMDCITEKPLTVDAEKVLKILALEKEYGRNVTVTFNYRFEPYVAEIKKTLMEDRIGRVFSVTLEWFLNKSHGADYFRRWHSNMRMSGGLLVHKATHHFDLMNWMLQDTPETVSAFGALSFYGKRGAIRGTRCSGCSHAHICHFQMKVGTANEDEEIFRKLYWDAEGEDGYLRDRCVFDPSIDIYDNMSAIVRYRNGAQLAYSLNAFSTTEGFRLIMNGTKGRLEAGALHSDSARARDTSYSFSITDNVGNDPLDERVEVISVDADHSPHGGGDKRLHRQLFKGDLDDPLGQMAGTYDGAMSCLVGIAANESIRTGAVINIDDLLGGMTVPGIAATSKPVAHSADRR